MKLLKLYRKMIHFFVCFFYSILLITTFLGVIFRYVPWLHSIYWSMEVSRYSMIWLFFLVCSVNIRCQSNIRVEFFLKKIKNLYRKYLLLISDILVILFILILLFYGYKVALDNMSQISPSLNYPMTYVYAAIPVGTLFMLIEKIMVTAKDFLDIFKNNNE